MKCCGCSFRRKSLWSSWLVRVLSLLTLAICFSSVILAECPNACSGHGACEVFDSCNCYRNWKSNDCSERVCQFGMAHVDSSKGDLDGSSGPLYGPEATEETARASGSRVAKKIVHGDAIYPKGTYEKWANPVDSRGNILTNTAHEYMECSNKGICNRGRGVCECFDGYEGSACQRASCPSIDVATGACNGRGKCVRIKDIAASDYNNTYQLWDADVTMGCDCDPGFRGPDCSKTRCKIGADPLYFDDEPNIRMSNFTFVIWNVDKLNTAALDVLDINNDTLTVRTNKWYGNYSLIFYDAFGQKWETEAIDIHGDCDNITDALEGLPNDVIPKGSVRCSLDKPTKGSYIPDDTTSPDSTVQKFVYGMADGFPIKLPRAYYTGEDQSAAYSVDAYAPFIATKFTLAFPLNPGKLKPPKINMFIDGSRRTIRTGLRSDPASHVNTWVFSNGFDGENVDLVPDLCTGVKVTLKQAVGTGSTALWGQLDGLDATEMGLLKSCLGDSDGKPSNNAKNKAGDSQDIVYNWDYGISDTITGDDNSFTQASNFLYKPDELLNPHLVKLLDTSSRTATRLCDVTDHRFTGIDEITEYGYCSNHDQPGFFIVVYYDAKAKVFKFLSRAHLDYASAEFLVFTTAGHLQLASRTTDVFTTPYGNFNATSVRTAANSISDLKSYYSNIVYTYKVNPISSTDLPNVDCETASSTVLQCIEKGDFVMILNTDETAVAANPKYLNIYQIMKIGRENRETTIGGREETRYQLVLDMGMNARYHKSEDVSSGARIYKFTPPEKQVKYVGECSLRGSCETDEGLCTCYPGFSGDDCSTVNALSYPLG